MVIGLSVVAGVVGVVLGILGWRRYWVVKDTPTSKCAAVFVGRNEVAGEARPVRALFAPMSGQPCVWFSWELERYVRTRKTGNWRSVAKRTSVGPFWIVDDTGGVLIWPEDATVHAARSVRERANRCDVPYSLAELQAMSDEGQLPGVDLEPERRGGFLGFIEDLFDGTEHDPIGALGSNYRVTEHRLDVGEPLYVLGHAALRDDAVALEFASQHGPLLLSIRGERMVALGGLGQAVGGLLLGAATIGFLGYTAAEVTGAVGTVAAYGAFVLGLYGIRLHNRLVAVKEQAATAWSLIDVALRRRHDLLPNLVAVAKQYAGHEVSTLSAVTLQRAEALPSDETVQQATVVNETERSDSRALVALAGAYPDLQADEVFRDLADRLVQVENQVAYARTFYNDAVTVLRDRRQAFPGSLLARFVQTPSWQLFASSDTERYVPPVTPVSR